MINVNLQVRFMNRLKSLWPLFSVIGRLPMFWDRWGWWNRGEPASSGSGKRQRNIAFQYQNFRLLIICSGSAFSALCPLLQFSKTTVHHRRSIGKTSEKHRRNRREASEISRKNPMNKENLNNTQQKILDLLSENTRLSASMIAEHIGISRRNVESSIKKLKDQGVLVRHGSPKNGYWEII